MVDFEHEALIRSFFAIGGLTFFFLLGILFHFRKVSGPAQKNRLFSNLILFMTNGFFLRLLAPLSLMEASHNFPDLGLFHFLDWPSFIETLLSILILDCVIYWQHRWTHGIPILWRLHRVHHSDLEFDTSTAGRFHFFEIVISYFIKLLVVLLFGIPPLAILIFEVLLNFSASFNHSNFSFPLSWERTLRAFIITPDLHRVHHSVHQEETNSNYGFSISLWDQLFGSYRWETKDNPEFMKIGLEEFREPENQSLKGLLLQPFRNPNPRP